MTESILDAFDALARLSQRVIAARQLQRAATTPAEIDEADAAFDDAIEQLGAALELLGYAQSPAEEEADHGQG